MFVLFYLWMKSFLWIGIWILSGSHVAFYPLRLLSDWLREPYYIMYWPTGTLQESLHSPLETLQENYTAKFLCRTSCKTRVYSVLTTRVPCQVPSYEVAVAQVQVMEAFFSVVILGWKTLFSVVILGWNALFSFVLLGSWKVGKLRKWLSTQAVNIERDLLGMWSSTCSFKWSYSGISILNWNWS